jgi:hypothetical protein
LLNSLESKDEWKISSDEYDDNIVFSAKLNNSFKGSKDEDESIRIEKNHKKPKVDPISSFKCKTFKIRVDGSINFQDCQIFHNINHFRVLREYEVKHVYHLKRYLNHNKKVVVTCSGVAYEQRIYASWEQYFHSVILNLAKLAWTCFDS